MQSVLSPNIRISGLRANWTEEGAARSVTSWLNLTVANKLRMDLVSAQNDLMAIAARSVSGVNNLAERAVGEFAVYRLRRLPDDPPDGDRGSRLER
jgi:hypothetical protein